MEREGWEIRLDPPAGWIRPVTGRADDATEPILGSFRSAYDLGEWLEWYRIPSAPGATAFAVTTTKGEFVLRASSGAAPGLRFETRLLLHLRSAGYPAPAVVPTGEGDPYHVDGACLLVTERIPGAGYDAGQPGHLAEAARGLARYHETVAAFPDRLRSAGRPVLSALERSGPHILASVASVAGSLLAPFDRQRLSRASSYLWSQFIRVPEALTPALVSLPRLVVHGSFEPTALRYQGDRLAGVVGYGRAAFDLRALDLAAAVGAFAAGPELPGPHEDRVDLGRVAEFVAAYREVADVADWELEVLPLLVRAQRLGKVLSRAARFLRSHDGPGPRHEDAAHEDILAVVGMAEIEVQRLRWLEAREHDVLSALCGWRRGTKGSAPGRTR